MSAHESLHSPANDHRIALDSDFGGRSFQPPAFQLQASSLPAPTPPGEGTAQLRRIPKVEGFGGGTVESALFTVDFDLDDLENSPVVEGENPVAHQTGMRLLIQRARSELTPEQKMTAQARARHGYSDAEWVALSPSKQYLLLAAGILQVRPDLEMADPALIYTGPRAGTEDENNINTLVAMTDDVFDRVEAGEHDANLSEIFGAASVNTAKSKMARARKRLNELWLAGGIVTERANYGSEVGVGGLTTLQQIFLEPGLIDNPADPESIVTLLHESMHAGNPDVLDHGYLKSPGFKELKTETKLNNAAHFEVIARRQLQGGSEAWSGVFTPANHGTAGGPGRKLTDTEKAMRIASERFRKAWSSALSMHDVLLHLYLHPEDWETGRFKSGGQTITGFDFPNSIPWWSRVAKLTIHQKTTIQTAHRSESTMPVSTIDIALSEGFIRRLKNAMSLTPKSVEKANALESKLPGPEWAEMVCAEDGEKEAVYLMELVLRQIKHLTGDTSRDIRVVDALAAIEGSWRTILANRDPADFAD